MKIMVGVRLGYGAMDDAGVCGMWTSCETMPGEFTRPQAVALIGTLSPDGYPIEEVRQIIPDFGRCAYYDYPVIATTRKT